MKQGTNISHSNGIEIIPYEQNLFSYYCGIMLDMNIKRYFKITHIFRSAIWHKIVIFEIILTNSEFSGDVQWPGDMGKTRNQNSHISQW